jgi:hypothetical protein
LVGTHYTTHYTNLSKEVFLNSAFLRSGISKQKAMLVAGIRHPIYGTKPKFSLPSLKNPLRKNPSVLAETPESSFR